MITLFELYQEHNSWVNSSQNGFWRPERDFEVNANVASLRLFNMKVDIAEREQRVIDELSPFFISKNIIVKNQNSFYGTIDKPMTKGEEYARYGSARILLAGEKDKRSTVPSKDIDNGKCSNGLFSDEELAQDYYDTVRQIQVEKIDNQRWPSVLNHLNKKPTFENPKITQINNQFQVAPRQVSVVILNYYREPKYATFKYTKSPGNLQNGSGDNIIYNAAASQPLEWPQSVKNELLEILKEIYIGFTRDSQFQQINQSQKATP